jgi:hypothetical protein
MLSPRETLLSCTLTTVPDTTSDISFFCLFSDCVGLENYSRILALINRLTPVYK